MSPSFRAPLIGSVVLTAVGAVAQFIDQKAGPGAAVPFSTQLLFGLSCAGQLGGNVLAGFLFEKMSGRKISPESIARNALLRKLVSRAISGTVKSSLPNAVGDLRRDMELLATAAGDYWPVALDQAGAGAFEEFTPPSLAARVTQTFKGDSTTLANPAEWEDYLRNSLGDDGLEINPVCIPAAANALHLQLPSYLATLAPAGTDEDKEACSELMLRMLSELITLVRENQAKLKELQIPGDAAIQNFLNLERHLNRLENTLQRQHREIISQLDALLTADAVEKLRGGGRRAKKEAARLIADLSRRNHRDAEITKAAIAELGNTLASAVQGTATQQQMDHLRLLAEVSRQESAAAHDHTQKIVIWASVALAVCAGVALFFNSQSLNNSITSSIRRSEVQNHEELVKLFNASKQTTAGDLTSEQLAHLTEITGHPEAEIREIIATGKVSKVPTDQAMAYYLDGALDQALELTAGLISEKEKAVSPALINLVDLHTIRAFTLLKKGSSDEAIREFKLAWSSAAATGDFEAELDAKFCAAAALFRNGAESFVGAKILAEAWGVSESDDSLIVNLFSSPRCCPTHVETTPGFVPEGTPPPPPLEAGWLTNPSIKDDKVLTVSKALWVSTFNFDHQKPGFHPLPLPEKSAAKKHGSHSTTTTTPVGYFSPTAKFLRSSPKLLDSAIGRLTKSRYFGDTHPYLMLLYLNAAQCSYAMGDLNKVRAYCQELSSLIRRLGERNEIPNSLSQDTGFQEVLQMLVREGFASPPDLTTLASTPEISVIEISAIDYVLIKPPLDQDSIDPLNLRKYPAPERQYEEVDSGNYRVLFDWTHDDRDVWRGKLETVIQIQKRVGTRKDWEDATSAASYESSESQDFSPDISEVSFRARFVTDGHPGPWGEVVVAKFHRN